MITLALVLHHSKNELAVVKSLCYMQRFLGTPGGFASCKLTLMFDAGVILKGEIRCKSGLTRVSKYFEVEIRLSKTK